MKRLLLLTPLFLAAYSGQQAIDITTQEPFQITCIWDVDGKTGDETYFIDPKLDLVVMEGVDDEDGSTYEVEYKVTKVTPRKIVFSSEWSTPLGFKEPHFRDEDVIDRSSGELTPLRYELGRDMTSYPLISQGWEGKSVDLDYEYDCQKPTRNS